MSYVLVRNEMTGEELRVPCAKENADAQIEALVHCFRTHGWRMAVALTPEDSDAGPSRE